MANPFLNDKAVQEASRAGWAAPEPSTRAGGRSTTFDDGPISPWRTGVMTVSGTVTATGVLMVLLLAAAVVGWQAAPTNAAGEVKFPTLAFIGIFIGLGCAIALHFKPTMAKVLAPIYALAEGFFLGAISKAYNTYQDGIVLQAVGATLGVFLVVLVLYKTGIIKVTDRFRRIVVTATLGLMAFYLVSFVIRLIAGPDSVSFLSSTSLLSIGFSLFAAGLASAMLAVDFDMIERGAKSSLPKGMEWYFAFGLLATIIWLYLELLRLLSKLQRR